MHVRAGAFGVIRVPAAYLGLSPVSFALGDSPRRWPCYRLTTLAAGIDSMGVRGGVGGKGIGYPIGAG